MEALDAFLPSNLGKDEEEARRRGRVLVGVAFCLAAALPSGLGLRMAVASLHQGIVVLVVFWTVAFALTPWLFRATGSETAAAMLVVVGFGFLVIGVAALAGGVGAPVLVAAPLVPIVATVLLGSRAGLVVTLALAGAVVLLWRLPTWGIELPTSPLVGGRDLAARTVLLCVAIAIGGSVAAIAEHLRLHVKRRLRRSEELYRRIFEQSKDLVILGTPEGQVLDANQAAVDFYGFASKEVMLGWNVREAYADARERAALLERLTADGYVQSFESRHRTLAGEIRILQGTTSTVRNRRGEVEILLAILRDVTDGRRAEAERETLLARLQESNAELERFTYTVSHDLKSPLVTVAGFLKLLAEDVAGNDPEKVRRDVSILLGTVDKMRALIDGLLELSQMGRRGVAREEVDVAEIAREVVGLLAARVAEARVEVEIASALPPARGDRILLRTVLQNLIDNAVKFSAGQPGARVQVGSRRDGEETVYFVADNGPGIAAEHREEVFGPFAKTDAERGGTGIGLAIVQRAVELQDGRVWVESPGVGKGSVFCFTIGSP